ncbi:MAG: hypothetical protein ACD_12C00450G0001, partial [uncultured bacterium]
MNNKEQKNKIIIYDGGSDDQPRIEVRLSGGTVWLS